jgi:phosphatidylserine/phosphatidylglycerophosphate/cardiolipin synthase-like enzyme
MNFQDWLLPEPKPGAPDAWRLMQTSECDEVYVHDSYQSYFKRLAQLFEIINQNDDVFLVGLEFMLGNGDPRDKNEQTTELLPGKRAVDLLLAAKKNGARVRILVTGSDSFFGEPRVTAGGIEVAHDAQGHHHQKAAYLRIKETSYLFVGGMDLSLGFDKSGKREPRLGFWFDAQAEIRGRAAELGRLTLEERWASVKGIPFIASFGRRSGTPHTFCQFIRTYPKDSPPPDQNGRVRKYSSDFSYGDLLRQAIGRTNAFIYLEDQYFAQMDVPPGLDRLLIEAVAKKRICLIVVGARPNQIEPYPKSQRGPLVKKLLAEIAQKDRLFLFQLKETPAPMPYFVHTKTWIFDDQLAVVGSANYWNPSFDGGDTEFGVAIASTLSRGDFPGAPFARALRVRMWNRLLTAAGSATIKPDKAAKLLDEVGMLARGLERMAP